MDFFNNLGSKIGKTAKTVAKKSEELVEITKLNLAIGNEEDKIKKLLLEIGSEFYSRYHEGENFDDYLNGKFAQVQEIETRALALKEKSKRLKGFKTCDSCHSDIKEDIKFCPYCGNPKDE